VSWLEYIIVGCLVTVAAVYAFWRLRRGLRGREGCSFMSGDGLPCQRCPGTCERQEINHEEHEAHE
jgi:hypothetical protein